ncbi:MAG: YncE family protein [Thaumarchaeota archaeon]|nr:YncE family protein [Candidatus Nitrosotalea sp.]MDE1872033.1 YncE family protein [Nitrososphaerota archaeon]
MRFRWWFVSMGITVGIILASMIYLGNFLCVPVENNTCISFLGGTETMMQTSSKYGLTLSSDNGSANVVVNPNTNRIYVANEVSHTISVMDGNTNTKIADIPTNGMPFKMAINPNTNRIYVTEVNRPDNKHNDTILVVDGTNNNKIAEIQSVIFSQIAINQKTNLVYVIGYKTSTGIEQNGTLSVMDGNNNTKIAQLQIGWNPFGIAVDSNTNLIYVLNKHYPVNSKRENSTVSVIDGSKNTKIADIQVGINPAGIAVNPNTHRIYVSNYGGQTVSVIDGISNSITGKPILLGPGIEGMAVNPITNRIYVADGLTSTVYVIDGNTDTKIQEIHPLYSWNVAVNPVTSKIYVPSYFFNNISIIDEKSYNITSVIQLGPYPGNIK